MSDNTTHTVRVCGRVFAANASLCHDAQLYLDALGKLTLYEAGSQESVVLEARALQWRAGVGQTPWRVQLADGRVFETQAFAVAEQLHRKLYRRARRAWLHRLESARGRHLIAAFCLILGCATASIYWGLPWLADQSVRFVPLALEEHIGVGVLETLDATVMHDSSLPDGTRQAVQRLFNDLLTRQPAPRYDFQLHFRHSPNMGANALALPGGLIIITDDLVQLAQSHDEIAGVLAHELGHVHHRHGLRGLARASGLSFVLLFVLGDGASLLNDVSAFGALFMQLSYSRMFEREADAHAVTLMHATGRNPLALADMLERLHATHRGNAPQTSTDGEMTASWLSTHPATGERIRAIRAQAGMLR